MKYIKYLQRGASLISHMIPYILWYAASIALAVVVLMGLNHYQSQRQTVDINIYMQQHPLRSGPETSHHPMPCCPESANDMSEHRP